MKKTKNSALFDTLYGLLIVFALVGVIGIFGGISSALPGSNNDGTSNVDPEEELFTIEAGVYTFDELIAPDSFHYKEIPLVFTCSFTNSSGNSIYLEAESIKFYRDIVLGDWSYDNIDYGCTSYLFDGESSLNGYTSIYTCKRTVGSNAYGSEWGYDGYRTITVPYDQQVDASAGKWFSTYTTRESVSDDSGSTEDGSFGETPEYKENTIYAGTYRFNDVIDTSVNLGNFRLPFYIDETGTVDNGGTTIDYRITTSIMNSMRCIVTSLAYFKFDDLGETEDIDVSVIATSADGEELSHITKASNVRAYLNGAWTFSYYDSQTQSDVAYPFAIQTIIVTEDTEVSDETAFNWFTSNTQMLIKAGTYRWNDKLSILPGIGGTGGINIEIPFSTPEMTNDGVTIGNWTVMGLCMSSEYILMYGTGTALEIPVYGFADATNDSNNPYWSAGYVYTQGLLPEGYGQIITITEDTYVPVDFGTWFVCNAAKWEAAETDTSEATATILNIPFNEVLYIPTNKKDLMSA